MPEASLSLSHASSPLFTRLQKLEYRDLLRLPLANQKPGTMSILRRSWRPLFRHSWGPLTFPVGNFISIPSEPKIEEETLPDYVASHFYPVRIGETLRDRYQVVGNLGFGGTATVWLARDFELIPSLLIITAGTHFSDYSQ